METAIGKIEDLLTSDPPLYKEYGNHMKGWYKVMAGRALMPTRLTIKRITEEQVSMHHHIPPPGENIPIFFDPFPLDESVPTEDNIEWEVRRLRDSGSSSPSGIRTEQLQHWIWEAQKANEAIALVTGSGLTTEMDTKTLKEANTEMDMEMYMGMAVMGTLALYHWKRVAVLMQTDCQEDRLE